VSFAALNLRSRVLEPALLSAQGTARAEEASKERDRERIGCIGRRECREGREREGKERKGPRFGGLHLSLALICAHLNDNNRRVDGHTYTHQILACKHSLLYLNIPFTFLYYSLQQELNSGLKRKERQKGNWVII
jgi:hypothetical protein